MKKTLVFFVLLIYSNSFSQFVTNYGLKIGFTSSKTKWDYSIQSNLSQFDFETDRKTGINIGAFVEFLQFPFFNIVTEFNLIQKGFQREIITTCCECPEGTGKTVLWKININYINFSVMAKPKIDLGILYPYIMFGPRLDVEIGKSTETDDASFYDNFVKKRFGLKLGIGTEFIISEINFLIEFVMDFDLQELFKNENVDVTTKSFDFRLGIYF